MNFITDLFGKKDKKIQRQKTLKRNMIAQVKAHQQGKNDFESEWDGKPDYKITRNPYSTTTGGKRRRTRRKRRKSRRKRRKSRKKRRKSRRKRRR